METTDPTTIFLSKLGINDEAIYKFILGRKRSLSEKTQYHYALDLEFLQRQLGIPLLETTVEDIETLIDLFEALSHSVSTIKRRLAALSSFFDFYIKHNTINLNPVKLVDLPKRVVAKQPFLDYAEFKHLLVWQKKTFKTFQKTQNDVNAIQFRSILTLFGLAGPRLDELLNLTFEDIRLDVRIPYIHIQKGKGGHTRDIALHFFAIQTLKDWLRIRPKTDHNICFINLQNLMPLSSRTIQRKVKQVVEKSGIQKTITPHGLRRTFATMLTEKSGATLFDIKGMLGHAPTNATDKYVGSSLPRQKELLDKIKLNE